MKPWDLFHKVISKEFDVRKDLKFEMTCMSPLDWGEGIAVHTNKGIIHILGDGTIIDKHNILNDKGVNNNGVDTSNGN